MDANNADRLASESVGSEIDVVARRELAVRALGAIADVLEVDVSLKNLTILATDSEPTVVRLAAKRALRCVEAIASPDSTVMQAIGEAGIYHYVEGVIEFGADERTYLALMATYKLSAEEVTGLYAVRQLTAEETNGQVQGFSKLIKALESIGISPRQAALDPEGAVASMDEAGFFVDHLEGVSYTYDRPIFRPRVPGDIPPDFEVAGLGYRRPVAEIRQRFEHLRREEEED